MQSIDALRAVRGMDSSSQMRLMLASMLLACSFLSIASAQAGGSISGQWQTSQVQPGTYNPLYIHGSGLKCGNANWWDSLWTWQPCPYSVVWSNTYNAQNPPASCPQNLPTAYCNPYSNDNGQTAISAGATVVSDTSNCIMDSGSITSDGWGATEYPNAYAPPGNYYAACFNINSPGLSYGWQNGGSAAFEVANYLVSESAPPSPELAPIQFSDSVSKGTSGFSVPQYTPLTINLISTDSPSLSPNLWLELSNTLGNSASTSPYNYCIGIGPQSPAGPGQQLQYCDGSAVPAQPGSPSYGWPELIRWGSSYGDCIIANTTDYTKNTLTAQIDTTNLVPGTYAVCGYEGNVPGTPNQPWPQYFTSATFVVSYCPPSIASCHPSYTPPPAVGLNAINSALCNTYGVINSAFLLLALTVLALGAILYMASYSMPGAMRGMVQGYAVGMLLAGTVSAIVSFVAIWLLGASTGTNALTILYICPPPVEIPAPNAFITAAPSAAATYATAATGAPTSPATGAITATSTTSTTTIAPSTTTTTTIPAPPIWDISFQTSPGTLPGVPSYDYVVQVDSGTSWETLANLPYTILVQGTGNTVSYGWEYTIANYQWGGLVPGSTCGQSVRTGSFTATGSCAMTAAYTSSTTSVTTTTSITTVTTTTSITSTTSVTTTTSIVTTPCDMFHFSEPTSQSAIGTCNTLLVNSYGVYLNAGNTGSAITGVWDISGLPKYSYNTIGNVCTYTQVNTIATGLHEMLDVGLAAGSSGGSGACASAPPYATVYLHNPSYSYSGTYNGITYQLAWQVNQNVENFGDATKIGQITNFQTTDPAYTCLDGGSLNLWTAPSEYPGLYVVHNGGQGSQCAYITATFVPTANCQAIASTCSCGSSPPGDTQDTWTCTGTLSQYPSCGGTPNTCAAGTVGNTGSSCVTDNNCPYTLSCNSKVSSCSCNSGTGDTYDKWTCTGVLPACSSTANTCTSGTVGGESTSCVTDNSCQTTVTCAYDTGSSCGCVSGILWDRFEFWDCTGTSPVCGSSETTCTSGTLSNAHNACGPTGNSC